MCVHVCVWSVEYGCVDLAFFTRSLQMAPDAWRRFSHANCGITRVTIRPNGRVSLKSFADVGHLPDNLITYS